MSTNPSNSVAPDPVQFSLSRTFNAPRDLVWKVLTEPEHLVHWWGPKGLIMISTTVDLRPGGLFHYGMKTPDGHEMWGRWVFQEIVPPERLTYIVAFSDADGGVTRHPMAPNWPLEMLCTTVLTEEDGRTTFTNTSMPYNASESERETFLAGHASMVQGFGGTYDQLEAYLATL